MSRDPLRPLRRLGGPGRSGDHRGADHDTAQHAAPAKDSQERGFIFLESLLSITLLAVIMAALTTFAVTVTNSTAYQRQRQAAVQLANSTLEQVRGLTAGDLALGRTGPSTSAQFTMAAASIKPWLSSMTPTADPAATAASTPTLPVSTTSTLNGTLFTSTSYLGTCSVPSDTSGTTDCVPTTAAVAGYLRVVVGVTWPGPRCPSGTCTYVTSTLVSTNDDPVFTLNQTAPTAPVIAAPGNQTSYVGDTSSTAGVTNLPLQLQLKPGTGVSPTTWQVTGLPAGLSASTTGLITGSPTTPGAAVTVTVTATDAFLRTDPTPPTPPRTFTWTVYPPVSATDVPNQSSVVNSTAVNLALAATGGSGAPYTWSADPTTNPLPPGLAIGADKRSVTGTSTAVGSYQVVLTATDAGGRKDTTSSFTWTVVYPPPTATAADRTSTVTSSVSAQFTATGGSGGPYTWTDPTGSLPTGLSISSSGLVTGKPTGVGARPVKLRVTDTKSGLSTDVPFTWTIAAVPTVDGLTDPFQTGRGAAITAQPLAYTCPTASCTLTLTGAPTGVGIAPDTTSTPGTLLTVTATSGTVYLRGTVATSANAGPYAVKVTPLDTTGNVVGTASSAAWTVSATPPTVTGLTTPFKTTAGAAVANQRLTYSCPSGSCTLALAGAPAGIGLSPGTTGALSSSLTVTGTSGSVYLRGAVAASTAAGSSTVTVTPTDTTSSISGSPNQAAWTIFAPPTVTGLPPSFSVVQGQTIAPSPLPFTCPSGACTITLTGAPAGVGIASDSTSAPGATATVTGTSGNIYVSGTVSATATVTTYQVAIVPTDTPSGIAGSGTSTALTVTARCTAAQIAAYATAVRADAPSLWYRLGETSGTTAVDSGSAKKNGVYQGGPTLGVPDALNCDANTAVGFNGTTSQVTSTAAAQAGPTTFSLEFWFSTSTGGGKIIGFGNSQTGTSSSYDRQVYLTNSGQLVFGVYNGSTKTITSPGTYLDGSYHHVVATLSPTAGTVLYVDGAQVGADPTSKTAESNTGWWRVGYDNLSGWPNQPTNSFFTGSLDEVAVYPTVLTAARVAAHYNADR